MRANTVKMRVRVGGGLNPTEGLNFSPALHKRSENATSTQAVILTLLLN